MQASNAPAKIQVPFANSGAKQTIPVPSQIGITDGRASFTDGFPPLTRTPVVAGGVPPFGTDMNGILNAITAIQQWQNAGWFPQYDSTFSAAVGGYPKNAILQKADSTGLWISTADNNTTNPDTGGAGWVDLLRGATAGSDTGTANAYVVAYSPAITSLTDLMVLRFTAANANTAASTLKVNGLAAKPLLTPGQSALIGGEIIVGSRCEVIYSSALDSFILIVASGGSLTSGRLIGVQVFATAGTSTYTPTAGTKSVVVEVVGGGGSGAGTPATSSGQATCSTGGSGGGYAKKRITSGFSGVTVTVGAGAAAPAAGGSGTSGGTSSFGALCSATGGSGGSNIAATSTFPSFCGTNQPGSGSGGDINGAGTWSQPSFVFASTSLLQLVGSSGCSVLGGGARVNPDAGAAAGSRPGEGGSGVARSATLGALPGGAGAPGIVIVWEYA